MSNFPSLHPTAFLPCVRPVERHAAPAATAVSAGLEHVENVPRRNAMTRIRHAFASFGGHVRHAFDRLVNPKKNQHFEANVSRMERFTIESLRSHCWNETIKTLDVLDRVLLQRQPVSDVLLKRTFVRLVASLELFQMPGIEGLGLPADARKAFADLLDAPVVQGHSARGLAILRQTPDLYRSRYQLMRFVDLAKDAMVQHAAHVRDDDIRALLRNIAPIPAPARDPCGGTPV